MKKFQAHPPIHPTKYAANLTGNEQRLYEYIVRHFLACVQKDAKGFETTVNVDIADEKFIAKGLIILEKNYLDVFIYEKWNTKEINNYQQGDTFMPTVLDIVSIFTFCIFAILLKKCKKVNFVLQRAFCNIFTHL